ncbi:hypothetical protein B7486_49950 [cyanobacterium TDX16]|nr:hypothetical protein B7486_49950 [cyanobacterium TDX16]
MMESPVSVCPVPDEQQPLNEYEQLKSSGFFQTATLELRQYVRKLLWIWGWSWIVAGPIAAASFPPIKHATQFLLCGTLGASLGVILAVARMYLGWSYVRDRLMNQTIFYEETGWYDGQNWTKPLEILTRDRLIVSYQVKPILQRLRRTFAWLSFFLLCGSLIWYFL